MSGDNDVSATRAVHERTFRTHDGVDLFYRHWPAPRTPARGAIVFFHRGHEHSGRLDHLPAELDLPEFDCFAWDARGHGRSPGPRGYSPSLGTSIRDVQTFIDHVSAEHGFAVGDIAVVAQSGALALPGAEQRRGLEIALEHLGNKIGGLPVEIVYGDSKTNPGATVQELSRVLEKERVHVLVGLTGSNEILAALKPVTDAKVFFIGANGGPAQAAGEGCTPYYFNASFQNEQLTEGIGQYMARQSKKLYLLGLDYEAGHGFGTTKKQGYAERADTFAFLFREAGVKPYAP